MNFLISPQTRAQHAPAAGYLNISMDYNAAPSGSARGTEVIIPDNASPEVRAAAEQYNAQVAAFAQRHGIADYRIRGVRTRSENGRGVPHTIHTEPFFNSDAQMQQAVRDNPAEFAEIYRQSFGALQNARLIAPHGVGADRGAASDYFTDETTFGELMANALLGGSYELPPMQERPVNALTAPQPPAQAQVAPQQGYTPQPQGYAPQPPQNALAQRPEPRMAQNYLDPRAFMTTPMPYTPMRFT